MKDDVVVVAALGECGEVVAGLGGMAVVEFEGDGALGEVKRVCIRVAE